jgi:hypothetical protein
MNEDYLRPFINDLREIFVYAARNDALKGEYRQPQTGINGPLIWRGKSLEISFDTTLPPLDQQLREQWSKTKILEAYRLFSVIAQRPAGKMLLDELDDFPDPNLLVVDPNGQYDPVLLKNAMKALPAIQKINVSFSTAFRQNKDPDYDTAGTFDPDYPNPVYTVRVRLLDDDNDPGSRAWPNIPGCTPVITYTHRMGAARMAIFLFHELLHIWFINKYYFYFNQSGNTGHRGYTPCPPAFFDEVNGTRPFYDRLKQFYSEVDAWEAQAKSRTRK